MIQVTIDGKKYEYPENCSYYEIAKDFEKTMDAPIVLVKVIRVTYARRTDG